ncbi:MAG TPA: hypothetical protein VFR37_14080 [Longimicrobium sp.]|nr:hypothetical protein [Longimicrobium sp.]
MKSLIRQVPPEPWPSGYGEIIAMLKVAPKVLTRRYGLKWFEGTDNLGDYEAVIVRLASGRRLGLAWHHGDPEPGTEVHADLHDDVHGAVRELLHALDLSEHAVTWMRDALPAPEPESAHVH